MAAQTLWLVFALVFFLVAAFSGCFKSEGTPLWGVHPGWLGAASVTCFFLIR